MVTSEKNSAQRRRSVASFMFSEPIRDCFELTSGETVNGWKVIEPVGRGGFGMVFKVKKGSRIAALKIYSEECVNASSRKDERWRFSREIAILKSGKGSFAPELYESGEHNGVPYFIMEYLVPVRPDAMPQDDSGIVKLMVDLTVAVEKLHNLRIPGDDSAGWIHCDIKPHNIARRQNGHYVLIDFGSAHEMDPEGTDEHEISENSMNYRSGKYRLAGTKYYEPPELCFRPCRDIYALGHVIRDCFKEDVPFEWSIIINKCISWQPKHRYPNVTALQNDIVGLEKLRKRVYMKLRTEKIKEQRGVERSLGKIKQKKTEWHRILALDDERSTAELTVFRISLGKNGRAGSYVVDEPLRLKENTVVMVEGPGCLEADISGPDSSIVVVRQYAVLNNVSSECPPENDLLYAIIGPGGYLNMKNIKEADRKRFFPVDGKRRIFRDLDATTAFLFNGPETFCGVERQTLDGIRRSKLPAAYRKQLLEFFSGKCFSVNPRLVALPLYFR